MYQFEKNKLYAYLGKELVQSLKQHKAYIAGGTITSLFCNREINDVDVYFRDEESILSFLSDIWNNGRYIVSHTKKATQLLYGDVNLQTIHFQYFTSPGEIFDTFDFTTCMGVFDFETEQFTLHPDFLKHNSQRILKFNSDTAFPIVSLLRVQKYEKKGYTISKPEFIRIILTCMNLDINTYDELKEQLGGMYGINYDKLFEDVKDSDFNLQDAIDKIANIVLDEDYFKKPVPVEFDNLDDILDTIAKKPRKILEVNGKLYKIGYDGLLQSCKTKPEYFEQLDTDQFFKDTKFYKFVRKLDGKYHSYYDEKFEYIISQEAIAQDDKWGRNTGKLYFNEKSDIENSTYYSRERKALLEVSIKPEDFINAGDYVLAKKCTVLREVPKEEYDKWIKVENRDEELPFI
jgi:hypothetical protein